MFTQIRFIISLVLLFAVWSFPTLAGEDTEKGKAMEKLTIFINGEPVTFTSPPLLKDGRWLVPLESFSESIGAKVEYPEGDDIAVVCHGDRCVPLKFGQGTAGALRVDGVVYASPAAVAEPFGFQIQTPSPLQIHIMKGDSKMAGMKNAAGQLAADFTLPDLNGKPRQLSDFRGKKTLLYLWASW